MYRIQERYYTHVKKSGVPFPIHIQQPRRARVSESDLSWLARVDMSQL